MTARAETARPEAAADWRVAAGVRWGTTIVAVFTVAALVIRLTRLDWIPLDVREATVALSALRSTQGVPGTAVIGAPLVYHAQLILAWLLGGGDVQARLVAVAAGTALVTAGWALRPALGGLAALVAAALLAFEPLWVYASRNVVGGTVAALALTCTVALWFRPTRGATLARVALRVED